jgi:DNA repair protein RadA/Sms
MAGLNIIQPVLYVSGEESGEQIRLRLDRLEARPDNLHFLGDSTIPSITAAMTETSPQLVIIDSLQTIRSVNGTTAGRPGELRDALEALMELAKTTNVPIVIVGHVTKGGIVAGPKLLEHLVDAVLYFDASEEGEHRVLYATKNRFGGITEVGIWRMEGKGLIEMANPAAAFLNKKRPLAPGTIILPALKGSRVFLVEVQALVAKTRFTHPQRRTTGFDLNRLQLLIAVLTKHLGLPLAYRDVHLNIVGGLKVTEPAADLAVALAIVSATQNSTLPHDMIACGELGLHGELRSVTELSRRIETAARVSFRQAVIPEQKFETKTKNFLVHQADNIKTAVEVAFPQRTH